MSRDALFDVAATVERLADPNLKTKEIIAAVRKAHPGISKKDVVKAAFYALGARKANPEEALRLHEE